MFIGDSNAVKLLQTAGGIPSGNYFKAPTGLQGLGYHGASIAGVTAGVNSFVYDPAVHGTIDTVILFVGSENITYGGSYEMEYVSLINTVKAKFLDPKIKLHLVAGPAHDVRPTTYSSIQVRDFNNYIKSITNVEVINEYEASWTNDSFEFNKADADGSGKCPSDAHILEWYERIMSTYGKILHNDSLAFVMSSDYKSKVIIDSLNLKAKVTGDEEIEGTIDNPFGTFHPKVTVIHSVNAAISANGQDVYYIPSLEDLPINLKDLIESGRYDNSGFYHGFAVAYDGSFDLEAYAQQKTGETDSNGVAIHYTTSTAAYNSGKARRYLEVLGYDAILSSETCRFKEEGGKLVAVYEAKSVEKDEDLTFKTVMMDTYKALGEVCYSTQVAFAPDSSLQPNTSPLQQEIGVMLGPDNGTAWDNTEGACWVFTTRTDPDMYWAKANRDKILAQIKEVSPMFTGFSEDGISTITLGDFCIFLKEMMNLYGEPVLTETEEYLLLQLYGKDLPIFMTNDSMLSAIKYLSAKGILNIDKLGEYDWTETLDYETMLEMLMAVKDKDSRYTFKDVGISIDPTLSNLGYFETTVSSDITDVEDIQYKSAEAEMTYETAGGKYYKTHTYDFLIPDKLLKKIDKDFKPELVKVAGQETSETQPYVDSFTIRKEKNIKTKTNTIKSSRKKATGTYKVVSDTVSSKISTQVSDTMYYWYSVPVVFESTDESHPKTDKVIFTLNGKTVAEVKAEGGLLTKQNKAISFNTATTSTWGGLKENKDKSSVEESKDKLSKTEKKVQEQSYTVYTIPDYLIDSSRTSDTAYESGSIYLAKAQAGIDSVFAVKRKNWDKTLGKIKICGVNIQASNFREQGNKIKGSYTIEKNKRKHKISFLRYSDKRYYFKVTGFKDFDDFKQSINIDKVKGATQYKAFLKQNNKYCLVSVDMLKDMGIISSYQSTDDLITLAEEEQTIYISKRYNYIVAGSCVYQAPQDVRLYAEEGNNQLYVDYRAVLGWSRNYLLLRDSGNSVSLNYAGDVDEIGSARIYTFQNNNKEFLEVKAYMKDAGNPEMVLAGNYPLANYIVFHADASTTSNGADNDILFVFKKKQAVGITDNKDMNYERSATFLKDYLGITLTEESGLVVCAYPLEKSLKNGGKNRNPPGIKYRKDIGYTWKLKSKGRSYKDYYKPPETNGNFISETGTGWNKKTLALPFTHHNGLYFNINLNTYILNGAELPYGTVPGEVALSRSGEEDKLYELDNGKLDTSKVTTQSGTIEEKPAPIGIVPMFVETPDISWNEAVGAGSVYFGTAKCNKKNTGIGWYSGKVFWKSEDSPTFVPLRLSQNSADKVLAINSSLGTAFDGVVGSALPEQSVEQGNELEKFDWENYNLQTALEDVDDFLTISTLGALAIIPRIALYLCILIIALSLVANIKPVIWFCERWFDPYKLLTLGQRDVHTIDTRVVFFTSLIGIAVFWLFLDGTILRTLSWIARFVVGVSNR